MHPERILETYMQPIFYFMLRKTSDRAEAEDLTRKHLKERMTMARTYGKRSFAPEEIKFSQNWNPASGQDGMRYVEHILPQNILLEAYDNPSTAEELSLALGVAMPYMENELNFLVCRGNSGVSAREGESVRPDGFSPQGDRSPE